MAPEQFQGRASPASDVYGIGATALSLLTGEEPEDLPHRGLGIDVARAVPSSTPRALVRTLEAMLEPDPERRAPTIAAALALGGTSRPPPPKKTTPLPLPPRASPSSPPVIVSWLTALLRFIAQLLGGRPLPEPSAPTRAKRDDVLRGVRVVSPQQAQAEAMRCAPMTEAEAEAWADEMATREAEQWGTAGGVARRGPQEAWTLTRRAMASGDDTRDCNGVAVRSPLRRHANAFREIGPDPAANGRSRTCSR